MFNKLVLAALLLTAAPAFAEGDGPGPNLIIEVSGAAKGEIVIDLDTKHAPKHAAQIEALAKSGAYDNVIFHRVIDGFMAQTGDVAFGKKGGDTARAGQGGSDLPDLPAEFSDVPYERGTVGMARANDPNSANSQFFIMFVTPPKDADNLTGQYTVIGKVIKGMDVVDAIAKGEPPAEPDVMVKVTVQE